MRHLYTALLTIAIPFILLRLIWRGIKVPEYLQRWQQRLGFYSQSSAQNVIWFHAVSVGETEASLPLVRFFLTNYSDHKILITTTTPTGSARVLETLKDSVEQAYLPYDLPIIINCFLKHFKPVMAVIMETEIWPNLYHCCDQKNIPISLVNARLSAKSVAAYRLLPKLVQPALNTLYMIATQTDEYRQRYISLGANANRVNTIGNIKFDLEIPRAAVHESQQFRNRHFHGRLVWIIASTHKGEEEIFLDLYQQLKEKFPTLLLILVPRHPERFSEVKSLCKCHQLRTLMRTAKMPCHNAVDVFIVDTMGELKLLYGTADVCFVGGSMVPIGGHNVLEPAAVGVPIMFGPHMENFSEIAKGLLAQDAAIQCQNKDEIIATFTLLSEDLQQRQKMVTQAHDFIHKNQGALQRIGKLLTKLLPAKKTKLKRPSI